MVGRAKRGQHYHCHHWEGSGGQWGLCTSCVPITKLCIQDLLLTTGGRSWVEIQFLSVPFRGTKGPVSQWQGAKVASL